MAVRDSCDKKTSSLQVPAVHEVDGDCFQLFNGILFYSITHVRCASPLSPNSSYLDLLWICLSGRYNKSTINPRHLNMSRRCTVCCTTCCPTSPP